MVFFGAEIHKLKEIVMNTEMEKCAHLYSGIIGMLKMNNDIIPVVDLHEKFYREPFPISGYSFYAIFILDEKLIAVPVNGVEQYYDVPYECLFSVPMILKAERGQFIQQIINLDGRLIPVLSLKNIFEEMKDDIWEEHNKDYS
ncbi:hypothetical protein IMSAGC019_02945 [Lachnospiraceae bacterium]|nr:hypothetical protein IMSAGC019_02945 [Lachnospiraceae bacterium]